MWLGIWIWLMQLYIFCHHRTYRIDRWIFYVMFLFGNMRDYGNMFYGGCWYYTMNHILMIKILSFIYIVRRSVLCSSIMPILLMFIMFWRLIMLSLLCSTINRCETGCFTRTKIAFWIIFTRVVILNLYKHTREISNNNIVRKKWNA